MDFLLKTSESLVLLVHVINFFLVTKSVILCCENIFSCNILKIQRNYFVTFFFFFVNSIPQIKLSLISKSCCVWSISHQLFTKFLIQKFSSQENFGVHLLNLFKNSFHIFLKASPIFIITFIYPNTNTVSHSSII